MQNFSLIVAMDQNRGIGKSGGLPWHLPGDLKHFKEITARTPGPCRQNVVIMGRKTWESLPQKFRPLPQRINVVLTRDLRMMFPDGVFKSNGLNEALFLLKQEVSPDLMGDVFVIGGGQLFEEAISHPLCQKLYLTHIHQTFDCDTFFPEISSEFQEVSRTPDVNEGGIIYHFADYQKVPSHG